MRADSVKNLLLEILRSSSAPLETSEILEIVRKTHRRATRAIVIKRLTLLRGEQAINGSMLGCGKGVWIWWKKESFKQPQKVEHPDKISNSILTLLSTANKPLETKEIEESANATRALVFRRLHILRGDGAVKGKAIGSGKGTWIWWRENAYSQ